jgi:biotin operon repressor|uniref:hypothetical protein n=1 Tax=Alistipes onderdonkii TaxID=328813 RepID=UPI003FEF38A3
MYRSFLDWEWYPDTNCVRLALHFILKANYRAKKWKGLIIDRGQLVTSRGQLSEETGLSEMQIRTAIDKLDNCGFITKSGTRKYTIITVCNYDLYQQAQDGFDNGCQPTDNQQTTSKQPTDNQQITTTKEYKKERIEEYTHTLVDTKKGVVGGKETEAVELIEWIATNAPCIASMPEPITAAQAVWLLQDYNVKDIRRLIATMQSKQAYLKHTNAYTAFVSYAKLDKALKDDQPPSVQSGKKYYTRDEAMAYIRFRRLGGSLEDNFTLERVNGLHLWCLKAPVSSVNL